MRKVGKISFFLVLILTMLVSLSMYRKKNISADYLPTDIIKTIAVIETYFNNFEALSKSEKWKEIISQGDLATKAAKKANRSHDEAKICAQLTSSAFFLGNYDLAIKYARRCHELSEEFLDKTLLICALYLESAIYRALADKTVDQVEQQNLYHQALQIAEKSVTLYCKANINDEYLKGRVFFHLGTAHADNPKGDLEKAIDCYFTSLDCYEKVQAKKDIIRLNIRIGKVYLLQTKLDLCEKIIDEVRPLISSKRTTMHCDYLEGQLKLAMKDLGSAKKVTLSGLHLAKVLEAKRDQMRLSILLDNIEKAML